jgi:hypothetical protein
MENWLRPAGVSSPTESLLCMFADGGQKRQNPSTYALMEDHGIEESLN